MFGYTPPHAFRSLPSMQAPDLDYMRVEVSLRPCPMDVDNPACVPPWRGLLRKKIGTRTWTHGDEQRAADRA